MITELDRSRCFGASDTGTIMRGWHTATFEKWWLEKTGVFPHEEFGNIYTEAGNRFEIPILQSLGIDGMEYGKRAVWGECEALVANLDGNTPDTIYEVKSVLLEKAIDYPRKVPLDYWRQVQVQMLATGLDKAYVVAYGLLDADYDNEWPTPDDIDPARTFLVPVERDDEFLEKYVVRLVYLAECLESGRWPKLEDIEHD